MKVRSSRHQNTTATVLMVASEASISAQARISVVIVASSSVSRALLHRTIGDILSKDGQIASEPPPVTLDGHPPCCDGICLPHSEIQPGLAMSVLCALPCCSIVTIQRTFALASVPVGLPRGLSSPADLSRPCPWSHMKHEEIVAAVFLYFRREKRWQRKQLRIEFSPMDGNFCK